MVFALIWSENGYSLCLFWSEFGYGFLGISGGGWTYLSFEFQMHKKEREICELETDFRKSFCWRARPHPSSETQRQIVGARESLVKWAGKNMARRKVKNAIFFRPFRLSLAATICPWVSEDGPHHKFSGIPPQRFPPIWW